MVDNKGLEFGQFVIALQIIIHCELLDPLTLVNWVEIQSGW